MSGLSLAAIEARVCGHFHIRLLDLRSARRSRDVVRPRQIAMYLSKELTPRSLPQIGRFFGGRDHTTVIHAVRQIEKLRGEDAGIDADVRALLAGLDQHTAAIDAGQADLFMGGGR